MTHIAVLVKDSLAVRYTPKFDGTACLKLLHVKKLDFISDSPLTVVNKSIFLPFKSSIIYSRIKIMTVKTLLLSILISLSFQIKYVYSLFRSTASLKSDYLNKSS